MSGSPLDNDIRENATESLSYESESGSEDTGSSSDDEVMVRPVFVSKTNRTKNKTQQIDTATTTDFLKAREMALERAENLGTIDIIEGANEDAYDGVDDADDVDPEREYTEWRGRERKRYERDMELLREEERAQEDKLRRENMSEEQLQREFDQRKVPAKSSDGDNFRKGAFFNE